MKTLTANEVALKIASGEFSEADITHIINAINIVRRQKQATKQLVAKMAFRVGQRVTFQSKFGKVTGVVKKICPKNIQVMEEGSLSRRWTVSPSLLSAA